MTILPHLPASSTALSIALLTVLACGGQTGDTERGGDAASVAMAALYPSYDAATGRALVHDSEDFDIVARVLATLEVPGEPKRVLVVTAREYDGLVGTGTAGTVGAVLVVDTGEEWVVEVATAEVFDTGSQGVISPQTLEYVEVADGMPGFFIDQGWWRMGMGGVTRNYAGVRGGAFVGLGRFRMQAEMGECIHRCDHTLEPGDGALYSVRIKGTMTGSECDEGDALCASEELHALGASP